MLKIQKKEKKESKKEHVGIFILLFAIIKKNIKIIIRSKGSSLIVLLGPLLIIALVGAAYNTSNIYDIRIGAYSSSYSELAETILNDLGSKQFSVIKIDSQEECISSLKSAEIHVCVIIPPNLETGSAEAINFHVDQSRVNLVWIIIDAISSKVSSKKTELSLQLTSSILNAITNSLAKIRENENTLNNLKSTNTEVSSSVTDAYSELSKIDLDLVGAIDLGKISQKLDEIVQVNNLSASTFAPVKAVISKIKNNTESVSTSLQGSITTSLSKLDDTSSTLEVSSVSISNMISTINAIQTEIESATGRSAESIVTPIKTQITPIVAEKTHLSFLFPTLIVLVVMLMALILSSSLIIKEKTSAALFRNYIAPVKNTIFILGHFLTNFIILALQLAVVLIVASIFFKGALLEVLPNVLISLIPIITVFILIGMLIGYMFRTEETTMLATISAASILLFFSSTILPLETLPLSLKNIAEFNPFVLSESILKKIMLFKTDIAHVAEPILTLGVYVVLFALLVYLAQKYSKTRG